MSKLKGEKVKVVVKVAGEDIVLGAQRGGSLDMSASTMDATSKDSNGWEEFVSGLRSASVSCDGLYVVNDPSYRYLLSRFVEGESVELELVSEENADFLFTAEAMITSAPIGFGYDALVDYSWDFQISGKPDFGDLDQASLLQQIKSKQKPKKEVA